MTEITLSLAEEAFGRMEAEHKLAAAVRVAEEAIRLMTKEQLALLRHRMDALEVGDSDSSGG